MSYVNHDALELQLNSKQPSWLLIAGIYILMSFGLNTFVKLSIKLYPNLGEMAHNQMFLIVWFIVNLALIFSIVFFMVYYYRLALFAGIHKDNIKSIIWVGVLCSLPLLIYYLSNFIYFTNQLKRIVAASHHISQSEFRAMIYKLFCTIWGPLGFGVTATGVVLASLWSFVVPIYEECLFTGILFNKIGSKVKLPIAVICFALIFALLHFHRTGFSYELLLMFFFGLSSIISRIISGCWVSGLITHLLINFVIFLPKWLIFTVVYKYST